MIFDKLLPLLIYPLGLGIVLTLLALLLSLARRRTYLRMALAAGIVVLWVGSTPLFAGLVTAPLEDSFPSAPISSAVAVDAIVVLGGGITATAVPEADPGVGGGADRLVQALLLWRAGKAKTIIVSGGNLPWSRSARSEAEVAADLLQRLGVPPDAIIVDSKARNTRENAVETRAIWDQHGFRSGILVTSAFHMPRAFASFRRVGLELTPWPSGYLVARPLMNSAFDFLPDAGALGLATTGIKEWMGLWVYRWRGWA